MTSKAVIVYKGRYGSTAQYALWLGQILQVPVYGHLEISIAQLNEYDMVIAGGSVYVGKIQIAKWLNERKNILRNKNLILFVVFASPLTKPEEQHQLLTKNIDKELLQRLRVFYLRGRLIKQNLSLLDRFVLHMGAALQKTRADKNRMLTDFDDVKKENLNELIEAIKAASSPGKPG